MTENLNIELKNIHFRIEDDGVLSNNKSFAFGIVLSSLTYEPTNSQFQKAFIDQQVKRNEKLSYTLCALKGFGCYIEKNDSGTNFFWVKYI